MDADEESTMLEDTVTPSKLVCVRMKLNQV